MACAEFVISFGSGRRSGPTMRGKQLFSSAAPAAATTYYYLKTDGTTDHTTNPAAIPAGAVVEDIRWP